MSQGYDRSTRTSVGIEEEHNRVHEGQLLYAYKIFLAVAGAATNSIYINCSDANFEAHVRLLITVEEKTTVVINKATVAPTSPTTPIAVYNKKYLDTETANAKTKLYESVTGGTFAAVDSFIIPAGSGNFAVGGQGGSVNEIIFEEDAWYRVDMTNGATTQDMEFRMEFYELDDSATLDDDFGNSAL